MSKYINGKIYKVISDNTEKIYIGSTIQPLWKRKSEHKINCRRWLENNYKYITVNDIIKLGDYDIVLIEDYPCERREQLHSRERFWIEKFKEIAVNKCIPCRTSKEYYYDNIDKEKARCKKYNLENKEKRSKHSSEKVKCECGCELARACLARHKKSKKHIMLMESKIN